MRGSRTSLFMIIPNTKRHANNTKTDQLPISEVITGLPRPYHHTVSLCLLFSFYGLYTTADFTCLLSRRPQNGGIIISAAFVVLLQPTTAVSWYCTFGKSFVFLSSKCHRRNVVSPLQARAFYCIFNVPRPFSPTSSS